MAVILLYHRVAQSPSDAWGLNVAAAHFSAHLDEIRRLAEPVSLAALTSALAEGRDVDRCCAITFDDGYADNLIEAVPRLEAAGIPATFFVPTADLDRPSPFWWDELEAMLLWPDAPDGEIRLTIGSEELSWVIDPADDRRDASWRAWETAPGPREQAYQELWRRLHALDPVERADVLAALRAQRPRAPGSAHRRLSSSELQELSAATVASLGSHTATHPSLGRLPRDEQAREISGSRAALQAAIGRGIDTLSYPFGQRTDYTPDTMALARQAGYTAACAAWPGRVDSGCDLFELPRVAVGNLDGPTFGHCLRSWLYA